MPKRAKVHNKVDKPRAVHDKWYYYNNRDSPIRKFRSSVRWTKCRKLFVTHNPLCCDPFKDHPERVIPTQEVHHIIGLAEDLSLGLVWANLAAMCRACHSKVETIERKGTGTQYLFR